MLTCSVTYYLGRYLNSKSVLRLFDTKCWLQNDLNIRPFKSQNFKFRSCLLSKTVCFTLSSFPKLVINAFSPSDFASAKVRSFASSVNASSLADGLEARVQLVQLRLELRLPPARLTNHVAARVANVTIRRLEIICRLKSLLICW
jgi:outer membrane usher protein FimD/PapC